MDKPTIFENYSAAPDIEVLPSYFPIPGFGILPINAFLIRAAEPVLVDTGVAVLRDEFMAQLAKVIDLEDLKWLWLTHNDQDHIGSLQPVLEAAPRLRVITNFLGVGKMSLFHPLPMERVYLLNPGQKINVGDRDLIAIKPPAYDAPETTGFYDPKSGSLFSADCFGALMSEPTVDAGDIESENLREGLITWAKVDSPWLQAVDSGKFNRTLDVFREMSPRAVLSCHLPAAYNMTTQLLRYLAEVTAEDPFVGPDQETLEAMLSETSKE
jgi:glyoxylase-like metal-dependent hydrolase (beta-lactamase superfamily II)